MLPRASQLAAMESSKTEEDGDAGRRGGLESELGVEAKRREYEDACLKLSLCTDQRLEGVLARLLPLLFKELVSSPPVLVNAVRPQGLSFGLSSRGCHPAGVAHCSFLWFGCLCSY